MLIESLTRSSSTRRSGRPPKQPWVSEFSGLSRVDDSMRLALDQARLASMHGDVPVGAVIIDQAGACWPRQATSGEIRHDPTAHAELLAFARGIQAAAIVAVDRAHAGRHPRALHHAAMLTPSMLARIARLIFGAFDPKAGAVQFTLRRRA